jgi:uncharacterized protein (TIGR02271 family)
MIDTTNVNDLIGATVYGGDGEKIGTVGQVYVDTDTQRPLWVTVKTGLFGTAESFAPLEDATFDEETALYAYYGNSRGGRDVGSVEQDTTAGTEGYDTSGPTTDDAMTRSEERLHVGTESVQTGTARLRKHIVTEMQNVTVPVSHEEVTVTREPITDENVGDAMSGPELSEEEHEVVLNTERVVVAKETVPVERVALGTETVTEQQQVSEEVAHEEIEVVEPQSDLPR